MPNATREIKKIEPLEYKAILNIKSSSYLQKLQEDMGQ